MPFPNEHAARLKPPSRYVRFRRRNNAGGRGVHFIFGVRRDGTTEIQAIRFDRDRFTPAQARRWLRDHGHKPIRFEPAAGESAEAAQNGGDNAMATAETMTDKLQTKDLLAEVKLSDNGDGGDEPVAVFTGRASTFGNVDSDRDVVERGAFSDFLKSTGPGKPSWPAMLWQHNRNEPIGVWEEILEDAKSLRVKGRLLLDVQRGREVYALLKAGAVTGLSIGYRPDRWEIDEKRRVRKLLAVSLYEISPVVFPANPRARIERVKSFDDDVRLHQRAFWSEDDAAKRIQEYLESHDDHEWLRDAPPVFDVDDDGNLCVTPSGLLAASEKHLVNGEWDREFLDTCWAIAGIEPPWNGSPAKSFLRLIFQTPRTRREMEWLLRDAGMSRRSAKAMSGRWDLTGVATEDHFDRVIAAIRDVRESLQSGE